MVDLCDRCLTRSFEKNELMEMKSIYEIINRNKLIEMTIQGMSLKKLSLNHLLSTRDCSFEIFLIRKRNLIEIRNDKSSI